MKFESISRNWEDVIRECLVSIIVAMILFAGWKLDNSGLVLIEIEPDRVFSLCTVIISAQIAFIGIAYSLITINSGFQNSQKYGITITDYLLRKKYLFLNQRNILFLEIIILVASIICMVFELFYSVCSLFISALLLLGDLSIDVFDLYRNDVIEEKMFRFLKKNLHNTKLNLLEKYYEVEHSWLKSNESIGRKPQGRLEELWGNELEFIDKNNYEEVHNVFVSLVSDYISSEDEYLQDYGFHITTVIIEKIIKYKQLKPQVDAYGQILDKPTAYGVILFNSIIPRASELFYSRTNSSPVYGLIYLMGHFDEGKPKYSHNTALNTFFNCIVEEPESENVNDRLKSLFEYFSLGRSEECPEIMELSNTALIHLFVKAIRAGKISVVEHELFSNLKMMYDNNINNRMLYSTVICYLYYIAFREYDDETAHASGYLKTSQNVRDVLERNCSTILQLFSSLPINKEFREEIHNWLSHYEIINYSENSSVLGDVNYAIDKCLIIFKGLAYPIEIKSWLSDLVSSDWLRYYNIISSKSFSDNIMEIGNHWNNYGEKSINRIITDLLSCLSNIAVDNIILHSNSIDDGELEDYLNRGIASFKDVASFGEIKADSEKNHIQFYIPYKKYHLNEQLEDMYCYDVEQECHEQILFLLYKKVVKEEIRNSLDIERYIEKVRGYDIHYGSFFVNICKSNPVLAKRLQEVFKRGRSNHLIHNSAKICFDADSKQFGLKVDNIKIHIRKLDAKERLRFYPVIIDNKHKTNIVNDIEVLMNDDEFNTFIDSLDRIIQVDFDVTMSAKPESGFCSRFHDH